MCIVHGHQIFGGAARHENDDVGVEGPVHECQLAPLLNGVLHSADCLPIFGKEVLIELISVIGSNIDIACIRQSTRNAGTFAVLGFGEAVAEIAASTNKLIAARENRFI